MQIKAIDLIKGAARLLYPNGNDIILTARQVRYSLETLRGMIDSLSNDSNTQFSIKMEDFQMDAGIGEYTFGEGADFDSSRPIRMLAVKVRAGTLPTQFVVDFSVEPPSAEVGETFVFTDLSTGAVSWQWDFGDGGTSTVQYPEHIYAFPGEWTITLTAQNADGAEGSAVHSVLVVVVPNSRKLLLHFNGDDHSTVIIDQEGHVIDSEALVGSPELTTSVKQFGTASLLLDGGSFIIIASSADYAISNTTALTFDCWAQLSITATDNRDYVAVEYHGDVTDQKILMGYNQSALNGIRAFIRINSTTYYGPTLLQEVFYNFAAALHIDAAGGAHHLSFFVNGIFVTRASIGDIDFGSSAYIIIGAASDGFSYSGHFIGNIDEFRLDVGTDRYNSNDMDANFTPSTGEYT